MIVDDSGVFRGFWTRILSQFDDIEVATTAIHGKAAVEALSRIRVDLVLLDVEMPEMGGLEAIPHLFASQPDLKIMMVSSHTIEASRITVEALTRGAHDFIEKPKSLTQKHEMEKFQHELIAKIRCIVQSVRGDQKPEVFSHKSKEILSPQIALAKPKVILVGSSTGGPNALGVFVSGLSQTISLPILIVQHMPPKFTAMLAECLQRESGRICKEATHGEFIQPGSIYIAPGDYHMTVTQKSDQMILELNQEDPENFCRPSVDVLFRSGAKVYGSSIFAIVLTGMGEDGKLGCEAIRKVGGTILIQDEASSVVWGMPGAVSRAGLAHYTLPLKRIADKTLEICYE